MDFDAKRLQLLKEVRQYSSENPEELAFKKRFIALISDHPHCFDRTLKHAHITGSAWVVDKSFEYALMTHHARLDKWLQLGGHADGEADIKAVSLRELKEESGLKQIQPLGSSIFDLDIHQIPACGSEKAHEHFDIRYFFTADRKEPICKNHESKEIAWVRLEKLDELTSGNRSILRMVEKTKEFQRK